MILDVAEGVDEGLKVDGFRTVPVGESCFGVEGQLVFGFVKVVLVDYCAIGEDRAQVAGDCLCRFFWGGWEEGVGKYALYYDVLDRLLLSERFCQLSHYGLVFNFLPESKENELQVLVQLFAI